MTSDERRPDESIGPGEPLPPPAPEPWPGATQPPPPGGAVQPPPVDAYRPGIYPAVYGTPAEPPVAPAPTPRKRRGILALVIGVVVFAVLKIGVPILVGTAVSGVLGGVFGGPFAKLPTEQRQALEQRIEAATGDTLKGLSDAETSTRVNAMLLSGLPRLSDDLLVERMRLTAKVLNASDVPTCARLARSSATTTQDEEAMVTALSAMDATSIGRWFEIAVSAVEADARNDPPQRTVPQPDTDRALGELSASFSDSENQLINALYGGAGASDADACSAIRALYAHIEQLSPEDLALVALYDASP